MSSAGDRLREALRAIPQRPGGITPEELELRILGFELGVGLRVNMRRVTASAIEEGTSRQAAKHLREVRRAVADLRRALSHTTWRSQRAVDRARTALGVDWTVSILGGLALLLNEHYPKFDEILAKAARDEESQPASGGGAPRKSDAAEVARELAVLYAQISGRKPTVPKRRNSNETYGGEAYGPFLELVEAGFSALRINASAETFANQTRQWFKAEYGENWRERTEFLPYRERIARRRIR